MECMVKVIKPFYAIKCIVEWLAGIYVTLYGKIRQNAVTTNI